MIDYVGLQNAAKSLIEANGRDIELVIVSHDPIDSDKPWRGPTSSDEEFVEVKGVFEEEEENDSEQNIVLRGEKPLLIAYLSFQPFMVNHEPPITIENVVFVIDENKRWRVKDRCVIGPGDFPIYYKLELEK